MTMEESPPIEKSNKEKSLPTTTKLEIDQKTPLKVLSFESKDSIQSSQDKDDLIDLLSLACLEVESGKDIGVSGANFGIVILANADASSIEESSITIYTTKSSPVKVVGILEFVKNQIITQS